MLITTECIPISNKGRNYTDCMEFSLLRFLQLCTYDNEELTKEKYSEYPTDINSNELLSNFINKYPKIYQTGKYYLDTKVGTEQRADWAQLVSDRDFLDYYRNDNAELFTSVTNIIKFFNGFFQMNLSTDEFLHQDSLNLIAEKFSNDKKNISINISVIEPKIMYDKMSGILRYISRPETEYKQFINSEENFEFVMSKTYLDIVIDGFKYEWMLYEVYFTDPTLFKNKFITGHSVIYNNNEM